MLKFANNMTSFCTLTLLSLNLTFLTVPNGRELESDPLNAAKKKKTRKEPKKKV